MPLWILLALGSAFFAALVAIFGKIGVSQLDSTVSTTIRAVVMAIFLVGVSILLGKTKLFYSVDNKALLFIILSGISGAVSWLFYFFALQTGPASGVAALDRLSVVFVVVLAVLFLGEALTWKAGLGVIFLTVGAFLMVLK